MRSDFIGLESLAAEDANHQGGRGGADGVGEQLKDSE